MLEINSDVPVSEFNGVKRNQFLINIHLQILTHRSCQFVLNECIFHCQVKEAEKQAMIDGIRENGSEAAEFVIRKVINVELYRSFNYLVV